MAEHVWDVQATEQALLDLQAKDKRTSPASQALHRYASAALARSDDWRPAHEAMLQLHVQQTPGATMPAKDSGPPDDWPPTAYVPYVVLRSLARWLVWLGHPSAAPMRRELAIDDIIRKAGDTMAIVDHYDPLLPSEPPGEGGEAA